ncbi:hypothetical protein J3R83DRAFT_12979 [Lanmaoa asiatica]|nr:hypothetical protein J3R83DRAFT_12979 [Lanmaoa asiatica]
MFSSLFSVFSALLLVLSHSVNAAPLQPVELLAFAPTITSPTTGTIWVAGSKQSVSWQTKNVPVEAQNYTLTILLGYLDNASENLDIRKSITFRSRVRLLTGGSEHPLATQVPIMDGTVTITVPADATFRPNYTVAVIGDSGDVSPAFTITPPLGTSVALH